MKTCVVIPTFKAGETLPNVIAAMPNCVTKIFVINDACPEASTKGCETVDPRVELIHHTENQGVGGAVMSGYRAALEQDFDIMVKVDSDGQMDPRLIPKLISPIFDRTCDYVKGNRFDDLKALKAMPKIRLFGNSCLSFVNKFTSGYWDIMDPTNGFTAIHKSALQKLPLESIHKRYFFESDMLFRLGTIRAVVKDMPMAASYGNETSHLSVGKTIFEFIPLYIKCFFKRVFYSYFLRDFNVASLETIIGISLFMFGLIFGSLSWSSAASSGEFASAGTTMLAAIPLIMGFQLLLSALHYDISNIPKDPIQSRDQLTKSLRDS